MEEKKYNKKSILCLKRLIIQNTILLFIIVLMIIISIFALKYEKKSKNRMPSDEKLYFTQIEDNEIRKFNNKFFKYWGSQTGLQLKKLCNDLISNANKNKEESLKLPVVIVRNDKDELVKIACFYQDNEAINISSIEFYIDDIEYINNYILKGDKIYDVDYDYSEDGMINTIFIVSQ